MKDSKDLIIGHLQNEISMQLTYQQYIDSIINDINNSRAATAISKLYELEACLKISKVALVDCIHLVNQN